MKSRMMSVILACAMLLMCMATAGAEAYTPGVYTGTAAGRNAAITVEVTVSSDAIEDVKIIEQVETIGVADAALERVPSQIVENQSLTVDAVAGATITRYAILSAAQKALQEAGASEAMLKIGTTQREAKEKQNLTADVLVIGAGSAGLQTAVTTAEGGREVLILEAEATIGGNAVVSGGWLDYPDAPVEMRPDNTAGYEATLEQLLAQDYSDNEYRAAWAEEIKKEYAEYKAGDTTKVFDSINTFALEYSLGALGMDNALYKNGLDHKATAEWFIDHGAEFTTPFQTIVGMSWPRWTRVVGTEHGEGLIHVLEKTISENNLPVTIMTEVTANEILVDDAGSVCGARAVGADGTEYEIKANVVVLATGGYSADNAKLQEFNTSWPDLSNIKTTNRKTHKFDSIQMALDIGAMSAMLDSYMIFPEGDPLTGIIRADITATAGGRMYINKEGVRFINETLHRNVLSSAIMSQTDGIAYVICTHDQLAWLDEAKTRLGNGEYLADMLKSNRIFGADSIEALAQQLDIDAETLKNTVETYNSYVAAYNDTDFGRTIFYPDSMIDDGPYYAYSIKPSMHITLGGIVADEHYNVLNTVGQPIANFYAVGEVLPGGSICNAFADGINVGRELTAQ